LNTCKEIQQKDIFVTPVGTNWEYDNDETIATCSGDVTLIITENYTE